MNAQGTWQWRLVGMAYFAFAVVYALLFAQLWNWVVAEVNIGLKSEETTADEYDW